MKNTINEFINFKKTIQEYAKVLTSGRNKGMLAIDINPYGIAPYYDDPENGTIYRNSISELAHELFDFDIRQSLADARELDAYADELTLQG